MHVITYYDVKCGDMLTTSLIIKIIQLFLFLFCCLKFKPTLRWVILVALIPTISLIQPGSYESGDFVTHIVRAMDMFSSLQHGIFPVRWAWLLQGGYGYPLFSFMTILPYYILCILHALQISFVVGTKIYLAAVYVGSAVTMWYFVREVFLKAQKRDDIATLSALAYVFAPYTLINLSFRAAMGELTGFMLAPLLAYAVMANKKWIFALSLTALLLSHPGITMLSAPWILLLVLIKKRWSCIYMGMLAIGLSAFFLLPAVFEGRFTDQVTYGRTLWTEHTIPGFQPPTWMFWSPWRYGFLLQGHFGEVANTIGVAQIASVVVLMYLFIKRLIPKQEQPTFSVLFCMLCIGVVMMLPQSRPIWNALPLIRHLQFPSRIMFYVVFSTTIITGYALTTMQLQTLVLRVLLFVSFGYLVLNWSHRTFHPEITDEYLYQSINRASFEHERLPEAMPIGIVYPTQPRNSKFLVDQDDAFVREITTTPIEQRYEITTQAPLRFQANTLYFPGWTARVDNVRVKMNMTKQGVMVISVPQGTHTIAFRFENTPIRTFGNTVSLITFISCVSFAVNKVLQRLLYFPVRNHAQSLQKVQDKSKTHKRNP